MGFLRAYEFTVKQVETKGKSRFRRCIFFDNLRLLRYTILIPIDRSIDAIIRETMERGEFDNLPGAGKPLDLTAYFDTPEEVRLANSILKNANVLPRETELLKEIAVLKEELEICADEAKQGRIRRTTQDRFLQ